MKCLFPYLVLFMLLFTTTGCQQEEIQKDMFAFDQAYIPVLYHVYDNDLNQAAKSIFLLDYRWQQFNNKYSHLGKDDADWKAHSRLITDWLDDTYDAIMRDDQLTAFIQLDHIKYEMMEMRRGHGIEYFLDHIWDFEGGLSMLSEVSCEDGTIVGNADEVAFLVKETRYLWDKVSEAEMNSSLFGFDNIELLLFENYKKEITEKLMCIEAYSSYEKLDETVNETIESFMKLLTLFGDFDSTRTFYAQSR